MYIMELMSCRYGTDATLLLEEKSDIDKSESIIFSWEPAL